MIMTDSEAIRETTTGEVDWMNRILIVDDDLDLCELLAKYLHREGFAFDMLHNGDEGVERALSGRYALLILDVMLPGRGRGSPGDHRDRRLWSGGSASRPGRDLPPLLSGGRRQRQTVRRHRAGPLHQPARRADARRHGGRGEPQRRRPLRADHPAADEPRAERRWKKAFVENLSHVVRSAC
jgi:CheY-like chemotaxis protein